jgi:hypothetical protein
LLSEETFNELVNRYGEAVSIYFVFTYNFSKKIFDFPIKPITENLPKGSTLIFTKPAERPTTFFVDSIDIHG